MGFTLRAAPKARLGAQEGLHVAFMKGNNRLWH